MDYNLNSSDVAKILRGVADKLEQTEDIIVEGKDNFFWKIGMEDSFLMRNKYQVGVWSVKDFVDYFSDGFDAEDNIMLGMDLLYLSDLVNYMSFIMIGEKNDT